MSGKFSSIEYVNYIWRQPWGDVEESKEIGVMPLRLSYLAHSAVRRNMHLCSRQAKVLKNDKAAATFEIICLEMKYRTFANFRFCCGNKHLMDCEVTMRGVGRRKTPLRLSAIAAQKVVEYYRPLRYYVTALYGPLSFAVSFMHIVWQAYNEVIAREGAQKELTCQGRCYRGPYVEDLIPNTYAPREVHSKEWARERVQTMITRMEKQAAWTPFHQRIIDALRQHLEALNDN